MRRYFQRAIPSQTVEVPVKMIGALIGRGGITIQKLREDHNVAINIPHTPPNADENQLVNVEICRGSENDILRAKEAIQSIIRDIEAYNQDKFQNTKNSIAEFKRSDFFSSEAIEGLTNIKPQVSYNFDSEATDPNHRNYISPGLPPLCFPLKELKRKINQRIDYNLENLKDTVGPDTMELAIQALKSHWDETKSDLKFQSFDVIATQKAMHRLFRFSSNKPQMNKADFILDIERVGNLIIIDKSVDEVLKVPGKLVEGFYSNVATKKIDEERGRYAELMSCQWNDLNLIIRHHIDAAWYETEEIDVDDEKAILNKLGDLTLNAAECKTTLPRSREVYQYLGERGEYKPLDITTCPMKFKPGQKALGSRFPNLYFGRKVGVIYGLHELVGENSVLKEVNYYTTQEIEDAFGETLKEVLSGTFHLLHKIVDIVREQPPEKQQFRLHMLKDGTAGLLTKFCRGGHILVQKPFIASTRLRTFVAKH